MKRFPAYLALLCWAAQPCLGMELKTEMVLLSDRVYQAIDVEAVAAESRHPTKEWLKSIEKKNRTLVKDLTVQPLAEIVITRENSKEPLQTFEPLMEEAKRAAARVGGNFLYLEKCISQHGETTGLSFKVYRVEFQQHLLYPPYLA